MVSQSSSVPIVNASGSQQQGLSLTRCVNTSPVGVKGSTAWQRAACLTWWNLQDHPLARANKARSLPADPKMLFRTLQRARGHHASTCVQTGVRKCPALTKARGSTAAGSSNWMQLGHFSMFGDIKKELEETSVKHQNRRSSHLLAA